VPRENIVRAGRAGAQHVDGLIEVTAQDGAADSDRPEPIARYRFRGAAKSEHTHLPPIAR
jgi:hypothetical protein